MGLGLGNISFRKQHLPSDGQTLHMFKCRLCGKTVREQLNEALRTLFISRLQHLFAKHDMSIHALLEPFFTYKSGAEEDTARESNPNWEDTIRSSDPKELGPATDHYATWHIPAPHWWLGSSETVKEQADANT